MKNDFLLDSVGDIDIKTIKEAETFTKKAKPKASWRLPAIAAAALLIAVGVLLGVLLKKDAAPDPGEASAALKSAEPSLTEIAPETDEPEGSAVRIHLLHAYSTFDRRLVMSYKKDMGEDVDPVDLVYDYELPDDVLYAEWVPFFVHNGRYYWNNGPTLSAEEYRGEKVAKITRAHHRQPLDYKENMGHVDGTAYAVKGYDPDFMLCIPSKTYPDEVLVFICDNGYSVATGADVLEDRLHASDTAVSIVYESEDSIWHGYRERYSLSADMPEVRRFIEALDRSGWCVPYETQEELDELYSRGYWQITLLLGDIPVPVRLMRGEYAVLGLGFGGYFLKPDKEGIEPLIELMERFAGDPVESADEMRAFRLEDARQQPVYGKYIPEYVPENVEFQYCFFHYEVDHKTKSIVGTTQMNLSYENKTGSFAYVHAFIGGAEFRDMYKGEDDDGNTVDPFIPLEELNADSFELLSFTGDRIFKVHVYKDGVYMIFTADNVSEEEALRMIQSCFDGQ